VEDLFDLIPGRYSRHAIGMTLVGVLMYALYRMAGHYYVDGVGYATIQATLSGAISDGGFLLLLAPVSFWPRVSVWDRKLRRRVSPSLFMGATLGAAFARLVSVVIPGAPVSAPAFAIVGMGAMVGGGTGAARTRGSQGTAR